MAIKRMTKNTKSSTEFMIDKKNLCAFAAYSCVFRKNKIVVFGWRKEIKTRISLATVAT
jgi:hypothetical protein